MNDSLNVFNKDELLDFNNNFSSNYFNKGLSAITTCYIDLPKNFKNRKDYGIPYGLMCLKKSKNLNDGSESYQTFSTSYSEKTLDDDDDELNMSLNDLSQDENTETENTGNTIDLDEDTDDEDTDDEDADEDLDDDDGTSYDFESDEEAFYDDDTNEYGEPLEGEKLLSQLLNNVVVGKYKSPISVKNKKTSKRKTRKR